MAQLLLELDIFNTDKINIFEKYININIYLIDAILNQI